VDAVAQALADPIRREILLILRRSPATAGTIASAFPVSRPAVSRHLRVLREAGLVRDELRGREREYHLELAAVSELEGFLRRLHATEGPWGQRFDALTTEIQRVRRKRASAQRLREAHASLSHERKKEPA
jgi:DNA-binding transcriptional ArsR family regulator